MTHFDSQAAWEAFTTQEIAELKPLLQAQHITLDTEQPHISGERFLMSGKKVVLIGTDTQNKKTVIIKSSTDPVSKKELLHEQQTKQALQNISFAYQPLLTPAELWSDTSDDRLTIVTECIDQPIAFLSLPLKKQFDLILGAFSMLESVHATTASHQSAVQQFGNKPAARYLELVQEFHDAAINTIVEQSEDYRSTLADALALVLENAETIDRYCGFLTHDDFALHNFRFTNDAIYLIDQASLTFGNKHESWARLLNYMVLYNQPLERAFMQYSKDNLAVEEQASLKVLRIYKLIELLNYHARAVRESSDDVRALSIARVHFWVHVLQSVMVDESVSSETISQYQNMRDSLRSQAEIQRQKALQQLL